MKAEEGALADVSLVASYGNAQAFESRAGDIEVASSRLTPSDDGKLSGKNVYCHCQQQDM